MEAEIKENISAFIRKEDYKGLNSFIKRTLSDTQIDKSEIIRFCPRFKNLLRNVNNRKRIIYNSRGKKDVRYKKLDKDSKALTELIKIINNLEKEHLTGYDFIYQLLFDIRDINSYKRAIKVFPDFVNPKDENGNNLFENILKEYGELTNKEDRQYYLEVIALLLETDKNINYNASAISAFLNENDLHGDMYRKLILLFNHYLKNGTIENARNVANGGVPSATSNYESNIINPDYMGKPFLEDLTFKDSFTIDSDNMAYLIEETEEETKVYVHVVDLSEYLDKDSEAFEYAKTKVFGKLFDCNFINEHVIFKENKKRFAFTIEFIFDKYGKRKSTKLYNSIIAVNCRRTDKNGLLKKLFNIKDDLKKDMSEIVNSTVAELLGNTRFPIIYKNYYPTNDMEKTLINSDTSKLTEEALKDYPVEKEFLIRNCFHSNDFTCVEFDTEPSGKSSVVEITDPMYSFPALLNQMMIKKYLPKVEISPEERMQDKDLVDTFIAVAKGANQKNGIKIEEIENKGYGRKKNHG